MDVQIDGYRVSFSDRYLHDVERDEFVREQARVLKWLDTGNKLIEVLGKVYDIVHPAKTVNTESEGE